MVVAWDALGVGKSKMSGEEQPPPSSFLPFRARLALRLSLGEAPYGESC